MSNPIRSGVLMPHSQASQRRSVVFRADGNSVIGGGHVMRCLALAERLAGEGWSVRFVTTSASLHVSALTQSEIDVLALADQEQLLPAAMMRQWPNGCDLLIVDHYSLDARFETACRKWARRIVVIDDLADRPHDCDLLIDTTFGRSASDYASLVPDGTVILAGSDYALLRPEFAACRKDALSRRGRNLQPARVLLSLGLTDPNALTQTILLLLLQSPLAFSIDVVIGSQAPSRERIVALVGDDPRVTLHIETKCMAHLMVDADLAIGAGGTTSWERCCLGLPSMITIIADNQKFVAQQLIASGAAIAAPPDYSLEFLNAFNSLFSDQVRLSSMADAAAAITDGQGTRRVGFEIAGLFSPAIDGLRLRLATQSDSGAIWSWRNDEASRLNSVNTDLVEWSEHQQWFQDALAQPDRIMVIGVIGDESVGIVRLDYQNSIYVVSLNIAPAWRGRGLGTKFLNVVCDRLEAADPNAVFDATIRLDNDRSRRTFERCGFQLQTVQGELAAFRRGTSAAKLPDR